MSIAASLCKSLVRLSVARKNVPVLVNNQIKRHSHAVNYRTGPAHHSKKTRIGAELVGAAMWWWVLWHLWHEYEHITGEFYYPDPSEWTNSELGIPADD